MQMEDVGAAPAGPMLDGQEATLLKPLNDTTRTFFREATFAGDGIHTRPTNALIAGEIGQANENKFLGLRLQMWMLPHLRHQL
jgi:hypothetical protein